MRCINDDIGPCKRRCLESDQNGRGFFDRISSIFKKGKAFGSKLIDAASGETGTAIQNVVLGATNKNPLWRPGFAGENHAILQTDYGLTKGSYIGPGTNLDARLRRGDVGITPVDAAAKRHDLRYTLAQNVGDIRRADVQMLKEVAKSSDRPFNKALGNIGIGGKIALETGGFASPEDFTTFGGVTDPQKRAMYEKALKQAGGSNPASRLRKKMLRQKALTGAAKKNTFRSGNYEALGGGQPGGANILNLLSEQLSKLLLPLAKKHIKGMFAKAR